MGWQWLFFSFAGRINRAKYWLAVLIYVVAMVTMTFAVTMGMGLGWIGRIGGIVVGLVALIVYIALIVSSLAVGAKRLHDRDRSGWWLLVFYVLPNVLSVILNEISTASGAPEIVGFFGLIPLGIWIWAFVELGCLAGTNGPNKYGPDPLGQKL
jgi:uncharacterized membrane protein YhaH (DUF805 family)